jgi:hypothetical protein
MSTKNRVRWDKHEGYETFDRVVKLCKEHRKSVREVCIEFDLSYSLLMIYLADYPECNHELEVYRYEEDFEVSKVGKSGLIFSCLPQKVKLAKKEIYRDGDGNTTGTRVTIYEKFIPPNPAAIRLAYELSGDKEELDEVFYVGDS